MNISLGNIKSIEELYQTFKTKLQFPDFYGMNWDAFWDAITGLTKMPEELFLTDFDKFKSQYPNDAAILEELTREYNLTGESRICLQ